MLLGREVAASPEGPGAPRAVSHLVKKSALAPRAGSDRGSPRVGVLIQPPRSRQAEGGRRANPRAAGWRGWHSPHRHGSPGLSSRRRVVRARCPQDHGRTPDSKLQILQYLPPFGSAAPENADQPDARGTLACVTSPESCRLWGAPSYKEIKPNGVGPTYLGVLSQRFGAF